MTLSTDRYKQSQTRLDSYVDWPDDIPVSINELVRAGWFYTGVGDRVKCPWCHGCVYNWEVGDTALGEHKRHFPSCVFIIELLNKTFDTASEICRKQQIYQQQSHITLSNWRESSAVKAVQYLQLHGEDIIEQAVRVLLADKSK